MAHTQLLISVVDDDRSVRRALRRLLRTGGYATEQFPDPETLAALGIEDQLFRRRR